MKPPHTPAKRTAQNARARALDEGSADSLGCITDILHVDMDAFFASVEVLHDSALRGKPVIVGGKGRRGVVASCSYEARAFGIKSAMPSMRAKRLCPEAVFLPANFALYEEASRHLHAILTDFTPLVEGISLDEAFLDVSGARRLFGDGERIAHTIRERVSEEMSLSCSVGVARVKMLAKLASEAAKPSASAGGAVPGRGVVVIEAEGELAFLHPLPVEALWGVGGATARKLHDLGVKTVGELAELPVEAVVRVLGTASGRHLHDLAWARDPRKVEPNQDAKSIGHEQTYARDIADPEELAREAVRMADAVATRLRELGVAGRTVTVKIRYPDFETITRSHSVKAPLDSGQEVARVARELLSKVDTVRGVRLLGVSVSGLSSTRQLSFDDSWGSVSEAIDSSRRRFGDDAVVPAAMATPEGLKVKRRGAQQWGPDDPE